MSKQELYEESLADLLALRNEFCAQQDAAQSYATPLGFLSRDIEAVDQMIAELKRQNS
jgi:hypothetical protein